MNIIKTDARNYLISEVITANKEYQVKFTADGSFNIRLFVTDGTKKKYLIPPFQGVNGNYQFNVNPGIDGALMLEDRSSGSWTAMTDIDVMEV